MNILRSVSFIALLVLSINSHAQLSLTQSDFTSLSYTQASWSLDFRRYQPVEALLDITRRTRAALTISVAVDAGTQQTRTAPVATRVLSYGLMGSLLLSLLLVVLGLRDAIRE
ncbi:hypothetical protein [Gilvimarinus algae]|uniref:Uncharacterized protein n=1 Tax=Gilvimarinus algae TaxID=3058037 RepID=A0ABT8TBE3_9GAMM|nr:hypothetical protein [Gilvimarinus sp. SDUM040014]MDO3381425.1 hypothetical protein [Gilvimarinus sp. SDUM040014]